MPNLDGTGPNGQGPLTGRGAGDCEGIRPMGGRRMGRGFGRGQGRGQGRGRCFNQRPYTPTKDEYIKDLKLEIEDLKAELKELEK